MKRYLLFYWTLDFPNGGFSDFKISFKSLEEAKKTIDIIEWHSEGGKEPKSRGTHHQIVDLHTLEIVDGVGAK